MNVPVAHIHGGDAMQGAIIDDSIRHAITKFAHVHFPASELSKERILKLGEEAWRVTVAGAPGLDDVDSEAQATESTVANALDLDRDRPLALLLQHPLTTEPDRAGAQMRATLDAVAGFDLETVVIYPNSDAGGTAMINAIDDHAPDGFHTFDSLPREKYLGLLDTADVMIGNSSSAIIEAPSFGLPAVDIGPRQDGRERADNIVDVSHDTDTIRSGIERALTDESLRERAQQCDNPYDQGGAAERIVDRLESIELDEQLLRKQLTY
jgi:UDP-N-acetylglucosamine 2-epimerase (non-hydrolysing)/GDP/UDP-N,N'-diacetylbacillosamine 2-epimerase (hydrolysing)